MTNATYFARILAACAIAGALATSACGGGSGPKHPAHPIPSALPAPTSSSQAISSQNMGYLWPLTVDHGTLECRPGDQAVFIAPDATVYALNDNAANAGFADIEPLRATGAGGDKISLGALRSKTLGLCHLPG
ncbi:DUF2511 domain-containing protein [Nocardia araoensis]|uniref:DUF2511 domain-containing protein n=1 Tax=Nocardia araoensis TaxID=228600 RepID=UPI0002EF1EF9|nr:DUF2511 domain-containing protein [Nocardia araoensis]